MNTYWIDPMGHDQGDVDPATLPRGWYIVNPASTQRRVVNGPFTESGLKEVIDYAGLNDGEVVMHLGGPKL